MTQPTNHPVPEDAKLTREEAWIRIDALRVYKGRAKTEDLTAKEIVDAVLECAATASQKAYDFCSQPLPAKIQERLTELEAELARLQALWDGPDTLNMPENLRQRRDITLQINGFREYAELVAHSQPEPPADRDCQ